MALVRITPLVAHRGDEIKTVYVVRCKGLYCRRYSERIINDHSLACDRGLSHIKTWHPQVYQGIMDDINNRLEGRLRAKLQQTASAEYWADQDARLIAAAARDAGDG